MSFFYLILIGILIGSAMIIPGVSGGVIAVIFGVYDKIIDSLINIFKDFKKNFIFLFLVGIGILIGMIWFSKVIMFLYTNNELLTKSAFIGLILGGVPYLKKQIESKESSNINYILMIFSFVISVVIFIISKNNLNILNNQKSIFINIFNMFIAGFVYSSGKVIPGISGSFILIIIGMYEYILNIISNPLAISTSDLLQLIPFVIGFIFGVIVFLKLINSLLKKHFRNTYSIIIGLVVGSVISIIPGISSLKDVIYVVLTSFFFFFLSIKLINEKN